MLDRNVDLSVVITVRDKKQLSTVVHAAVIQQKKTRFEYELVVVDFGSIKQDVERELVALKKFYDPVHSVRLVTVKNVPIFNRSIANNIGFRFALGNYVFTLDADVVCPGDYFQALVNRAGPQRCIRCIGKESSTMIYRKWCGSGIMLVPIQGVYDVTGYDESFVGYGEEDIDFKTRLIRAEYSVVDMKEPAWIHLSHSARERGQAQFCSRLKGGANLNKKKRLLNAQLGVTVVNGENWGSGQVYQLCSKEIK